MTAPLFLIDLPIRGAWSNAEALRVAVIRCLETVYEAPDDCHVYGMVAGELVENALKYGRWDDAQPGPSNRLRLCGDQDQVAIEVTHATPAQPAAITRLFELLGQLREGPTAQAVYHAKIQEVALGKEGSGGLGLARIAFEARCQLSARRLPDGRLAVRASAPAPRAVSAA